MGEKLHRTILGNQHKTFTHVYRQIKKAQTKNRMQANDKRKPVLLEVGDAVYLRNHQRKSKLDMKWKPYYRITNKLTPVTFVVRNQLDGTERSAHADHLARAPVGQWNIPQPKGRPPRRARLAVPEDSVSSGGHSSDDESSDVGQGNGKPIDRKDRLLRQERDGSSSEDDIPIAELQKRIKLERGTHVNARLPAPVVTEESDGEYVSASEGEDMDTEVYEYIDPRVGRESGAETPPEVMSGLD